MLRRAPMADLLLALTRHFSASLRATYQTDACAAPMSDRHAEFNIAHAQAHCRVSAERRCLLVPAERQRGAVSASAAAGHY